MDTDELVLVTASMMHDIGKIRQRRDPSKGHADHGCDMIRSIQTLPFLDILSKLVKYHHSDPSSTDLDEKHKSMLEILEEADRLSAAHDRQDRDERQTATKKLQKVYGLVAKDAPILNSGANDSSLVEPNRIDGSSDYFPLITLGNFLDDPMNIKEGWENASYNHIETEVSKDIQKIRYRDQDKIGFLNTLLSAIEMDLAFVPSAYYYSFGDISLYHHLKLTAAIALSKFRNLRDNGKGFMLIGCNLSGIQKYIFRHYISEHADEKATRRLRGRSFIVSLFTDAIISYLLKRLDLPRANVIYHKSDGFVILCSYSQEIEMIVKSARTEIERFSVEWGRDLSPSIAYVRIDEEYLDPERYTEEKSFGGAVDQLTSLINRRKDSVLEDDPVSLFAKKTVPNDKEENLCDFCGLDYGPLKDESHKCSYCEREEMIGSKVVKSEKFSMSIYGKEHRSQGDMQFNFGDTCISYSFINEGDETVAINPTSFLYNSVENSWRPMLLGNYVPTKGSKEVKTLKEILKCEESTSFRKCINLGVIKMDMDNMGAILTARVKRKTISIFSSFMFYTLLFYASIVNKIAENDDYETYIVYSGGDDLTAFSSAISILKFADALHREFNKYFAYDSVTVSAGAGAFEPMFPIRRATEIANDLLEKSKVHVSEDKNRSKDSIAVFGNTMFWDEFSRAMKTSENFVFKQIKEGKIHKFFPYFLIDLDKGSIYDEPPVSKNKTLFVPDPYISYYISRNYSDKEGLGSMISKLTEKETIKNMRFIAYYSVLMERLREEGD